MARLMHLQRASARDDNPTEAIMFTKKSRFLSLAAVCAVVVGSLLFAGCDLFERECPDFERMSDNGYCVNSWSGGLRSPDRCVDSDDCSDPSFPNCDRETAQCMRPCLYPEQCIDPEFPNCDGTSTGSCQPPCTADSDCSPKWPLCGDDGICRID